MKKFWWKSAIVAAFISVLSHVAVMAVAQTVSAPYPPGFCRRQLLKNRNYPGLIGPSVCM